MAHLSKEQGSWLRIELARTLEQLRKEITDALRQADTEGAIHLANHIEEIDDQAVADLETALDIASLERDVAELRQVEAAIGRIEAGTYGLCIDCGARIPFVRLRANASATRCVSCQRAVEGDQRPSRSRAL